MISLIINPSTIICFFGSIIVYYICLYFYRSVRYPRAGEINPTTKLYVRKLNEVHNKEVIPPSKVLAWEEYLYTDVLWASDTDFR